MTERTYFAELSLVDIKVISRSFSKLRIFGLFPIGCQGKLSAHRDLSAGPNRVFDLLVRAAVDVI